MSPDHPSPSLLRACLALLLAASPASLWAGAPAQVSESILEVEGRVREVLDLDLDGDGLNDLVVFSIAGHGEGVRRLVSVFWQDRPGRFPARPEQVWELEPGVVAVDSSTAGQGAGGPGLLYTLQPDGVHAHVLRRGTAPRAARLVDVPLPHMIPEPTDFGLTDFAGPWSSDGVDFLVPGLPHPMLFPSRGGPRGAGILLPVKPVPAYGREPGSPLVARYTFPPRASFASGGEGRRRIAVFQRDRVAVLDPWTAYDDGGGGPSVAARRLFPVEILTDAEALQDETSVRAELVDLDGDGSLDLVAVVFRETGVLELSGRLMIFRGRPDGAFPRAADQTVEIPDALYNLARVLDLDGDGRMEIAVPATKLGLWGYLRFLTSRKVSFSLLTLVLEEDSRYDPASISRDGFAFRLSTSYDIPSVVYADLIGDELIDVAMGRGEDRMCIYRGIRTEGGRRFEAKPQVCFVASPYDRYVRIQRADGGKKMLARFSIQGERRNTVTVTEVAVE